MTMIISCVRVASVSAAMSKTCCIAEGVLCGVVAFHTAVVVQPLETKNLGLQQLTGVCAVQPRCSHQVSVTRRNPASAQKSSCTHRLALCVPAESVSDHKCHRTSNILASRRGLGEAIKNMK